MIEENKHIEQLFQEKFSDFSIQPSPGLWSKLAGKLFWKEFLSFNVSSFNVYYLSAAVGVVATGIVLLSGPSESKISEDSPEYNLEQSGTTVEQSEKIEAKAEAKAKVVDVEEINQIKEKNIATEEAIGDSEVKESKPQSQDDRIAETTDDNLKQLEIKDEAKAKEYEGLDLILKPPTAEYSASATQGCGTLTVRFTNRSQFAENYVWHFGDGGTSTEESPVYTYDEPGEYEVWLEAAGAGGETNGSGETIRVYEPPEANFVISPEDVTIPEEPVTFYNHSKNAIRYRWDFGDLSTATEAEPVHYYLEEGKFDVRLDAWNEAGCHDSMIVQDALAGSGCRIEFPTAFAPNPNGPSNGYYTDGPTGNEVFHPVCQGVVEYRLRIYNRTGSLVFESTDINIGWDGYIKGSLAKQDVYVWKVQGRFRNGREFIQQGNVTLIVKK